MAKKILFGVIGIVLIIFIAFFITSRMSSTVVVERSFDASPERAWTHWNDVESIKNWWSPKGYSAPIVKNDLRVDGTFLLSMKAPDGKMHWNTGKYKEIVPYQKIVSVMSFSDENGNIVPGNKVEVPGKWPDEITVIVEFRESGGRTFIKVTEIGIPTLMYFFSKMGWEQQFDKFESVLK